MMKSAYASRYVMCTRFMVVLYQISTSLQLFTHRSCFHHSRFNISLFLIPVFIATVMMCRRGGSELSISRLISGSVGIRSFCSSFAISNLRDFNSRSYHSDASLSMFPKIPSSRLFVLHRESPEAGN